jgi:p-hydroxybenzoate 3-monooxygenase
MRTQVGIVGAGPAGLLLAQMLHKAGIDSVIVEAKDQTYVMERVRAGVLEQGTVDTLREAGVGARMDAERMEQDGMIFGFGGENHFIDVKGLTGGRTVSVYGQQAVVRDLIAAREVYGAVMWNCEVEALSELETERPKLQFTQDGEQKILECDYIAGADGFWGICRRTIPHAKTYDFTYPYSWLGILAQARPASEKIIYAAHDDGFSLLSMRSPEVSRLYLQCGNDDDIANWPDGKIWDELDRRLGQGSGFAVNRGPVLQKGIAPLRSFVCETMRHGRLLLAGDAAHIVPPTGAKGLNLAVADVRVLAAALIEALKQNSTTLLDRYEAICLARVWRIERFSWWVTTTFHRDPRQGPFEARLRRATLESLVSSRALATSFAEVFAGLPFAV